MAFTSSDLAALDRAIASGELSVAYDGKRVEYRSVAELQAARALVLNELQAAGADRAVRTGLMSRTRD